MRHIIITLTLVGTLGCGNLLDGETRDGALSPHDDVIVVGETTDEPGEICEYPSILSGQHFSIDLRDCVKIEGSQLGDELTLDLNGESIVIGDWVTKEGEREYVGFHVDGDAILVIKAGTDLFEAQAGDWVHPAGLEGPQAKGISFIAFCEPPTDEPVCTPNEPGGGEPGGGEPGGGEPGDGGGGEPGDGDDYCDPHTCEPGGSIGGSGDDGSGSGDGGEDDGSTESEPTGGSGSGGTISQSCAVAACGADNSCGDNQACFEGCCINVSL